MHLPTFWYDRESSFCIVKFGGRIWDLNEALDGHATNHAIKVMPQSRCKSHTTRVFFYFARIPREALTYVHSHMMLTRTSKLKNSDLIINQCECLRIAVVATLKRYSKALKYEYRVKTAALGILKRYSIISLTLYLEWYSAYSILYSGGSH
jgi:hypothetical protein